MEHPASGRRMQDYLDALEDERRKIEVFRRELPLCLQLITHAIESCKQHIASEILFPGRSDCEATSSEGPVLEEFIPIKRSLSSDGDKHAEKNEGTTKKMDWLRSVQLWTPENDSAATKEDRRSLLLEPKKGSGAFQPFNREDKRLATSTSSTAETGGRDDKDGHLNQRKARRCWSPELHRRFLNALQQLGGCHAATPKQIRELMKVDGLTNDEVKSHLQKYRLHTRRPSPTSPSANTPAQHFVVVGGIWVPPADYSAAVQPSEGASGPTSEIYAPVRTFRKSPKSQQKQKLSQECPSSPLHSEGQGSRAVRSVGDDDANSNSPATSSSTQTTTSPA